GLGATDIGLGAPDGRPRPAEREPLARGVAAGTGAGRDAAGPDAEAARLDVVATAAELEDAVARRPPTLEDAVARRPPALGGLLLAAARETLVATLAVELLAVPVIGATFGRVSVVSPVANLLVLPAVPLAMATSLAVALGGALPDWLVAPLAWAAWVPLAW